MHTSPFLVAYSDRRVFRNPSDNTSAEAKLLELRLLQGVDEMKVSIEYHGQKAWSSM